MKRGKFLFRPEGKLGSLRDSILFTPNFLILTLRQNFVEILPHPFENNGRSFFTSSLVNEVFEVVPSEIEHNLFN